MRVILLSLLLVACEGPAGSRGAPGSDGSQGPAGEAGIPGESAAPVPWLTQPGVAIQVTNLAVSSSTATVSFTLTDGNGIAVDPSGTLTAGTVELDFVLAQLAQNPDGSAAQYTAYTTEVQTSPITGASATQATTESTGTLHVVDVTQGTYTYDVAAPLTGLVPTLTQTVAALAVRGPAKIARATASARPDGGAVVTREVVTTGTCESCHPALGAHGGRWTETDQCILCHQPQTSDPDTGNTVDFKVMVHKIHRGKNLPSVAGGKPYRIIGYGQSVHDFSSVGFPQNIARCQSCHVGAEADRWETAPAKPACTSCHDNIAFTQPVPAGMVLHGGGVQTDESTCKVCHPATGSIAGISDMHLTGLLSPTAPTVELSIQSITNTGPGQIPTLTFQALINGVPRDLLAQPLTSLVANLAGPTTDYAAEWGAKVQGSGATGTLAVVDASQQIFSYTFPATAAIPATATGSYSVAMEGYLQPTPADPRYAAVNPVLTFAVTDATPQPRRAIVARENCNGCHYDLAAHGGARKNTQYCVFCHNPASYDSAGAPRFFGTTNVVAETIDFRHMIHKVHAGSRLSEGYVLGGFPLPTVANPAGTQLDFGDIRYPRDLKDCEACHTGPNWMLPSVTPPSYQPSTSALLSCSEVTATTTFCDAPFWTVSQTIVVQPQASVCTSCHDSPAVAAHAQLETTPAGVEACATCHGPGAVEDVGVLHGLP